MTDALRELHRIIDQRIRLREQDAGREDVRGIVTEVAANRRVLSARLDGSDVSTPEIAYHLGIDPQVGDDVLVRRGRDGFLLAAFILRRG